MARFLSQAWLDLHLAAAVGLPERPGATARVQHVVTGTPDGEVRYFQSLVDGRVSEVGLGDDAGAEVTYLQTYAAALEVARGEVGADVAFMRGRLKVTGDMGKVMDLMPLTTSGEYRSLIAEVSAQTEY